MKISTNKTTIIENNKLTDSFYLMKIANKIKEKPEPGQFISLKIEQCDHLLRRPFGVFHYDEKFIQILYKVVGKTTQTMSKLAKDAEIDYLGYLGKPFEEKFKNKNIWLVAGGIGLGGINLFINSYRKQNNIKLFVGLNYAQEALVLNKYLNEPGKKNFLQISVMEKTNKFFHGDIVKFFLTQKEKPDVIIACGPEQMLKNLYENYVQIHQVQAWFSMENMMACGIGACMGCNIKIKQDGTEKLLRVCKEGPVFNAEDIVWE